MENIAITLIVITLLLLVIIVGLLTLLVYKLFKQGSTIPSPIQPDSEKSEFHPGIMERIKELNKIKAKRPDIFCMNHPNEPGETTCSICDELFCNACIKPYKSLYFCQEHLPLVMRHEWQEVFTVKTSTQNPEEGVNLYQAKIDLFKSKEIPTYIETHYKINVDHDHIETYLVVFAMTENMEIVRENLQINI